MRLVHAFIVAIAQVVNRWSERWMTRLEHVPAAADPFAPAAPPDHWLAMVRQGAPGLLRPQQQPGTLAATTTPARFSPALVPATRPPARRISAGSETAESRPATARSTTRGTTAAHAKRAMTAIDVGNDIGQAIDIGATTTVRVRRSATLPPPRVETSDGTARTRRTVMPPPRAERPPVDLHIETGATRRVSRAATETLVPHRARAVETVALEPLPGTARRRAAIVGVAPVLPVAVPVTTSTNAIARTASLPPLVLPPPQILRKAAPLLAPRALPITSSDDVATQVVTKRVLAEVMPLAPARRPLATHRIAPPVTAGTGFLVAAENAAATAVAAARRLRKPTLSDTMVGRIIDESDTWPDLPADALEALERQSPWTRDPRLAREQEGLPWNG